jgi:hypothetical protein
VVQATIGLKEIGTIIGSMEGLEMTAFKVGQAAIASWAVRVLIGHYSVCREQRLA